MDEHHRAAKGSAKKRQKNAKSQPQDGTKEQLHQIKQAETKRVFM
jgi:hypothetical protein